MTITYQEYRKEINELAESVVSEAIDLIRYDGDEPNESEVEDCVNDTLLFETIDGHQWVIYYAYNDDVLNHSDNEDYMSFNFGDDMLGSILSESGFDTLKMQMAFWAMYADVQELIGEEIEKQLAEEL